MLRVMPRASRAARSAANCTGPTAGLLTAGAQMCVCSRRLCQAAIRPPAQVRAEGEMRHRHLEVASGRRTKGEYRCLLCDRVLEVLDGSTEVAISLTVQPEKAAT